MEIPKENRTITTYRVVRKQTDSNNKRFYDVRLMLIGKEYYYRTTFFSWLFTYISYSITMCDYY